MLSTFSRFAQDAVYPYGSGGPNASFALITRNYMKHYGATREDFGKICVAQRDNALSFPHALMKKPLTLDEYLGARAISDPSICSTASCPCAGAEAFLVCREDVAKGRDTGGTAARHHRAATTPSPTIPIQYRGGWAMDVPELYAMAGMTATTSTSCRPTTTIPVICMMQMETWASAAKGEGPDFVARTRSPPTAAFPHNILGGQLSVGQAGAAAATSAWSRRCASSPARCSARRCRCRIGLVSGFGMITYDRGLASGAAAGGMDA
jgi:acetyl-CoA acetyltransferase